MKCEALRARIDKEGIKVRKVAEHLGLTAQGLYNKLSGVSEFSQSELAILKEVLHLSDSDFLALFFSVQGIQSANQKGGKNEKQ